MYEMALLVFLLSLLTAQLVLAQDGCTLSASGEDDAASFLTAAQSCAMVTVPAGTTLNISTRLEMTGLQDTTIVVEGAIKFFADIDYWSENAFSIPFQDQVTFWELGGTNIILTGGGTLDGSGQAWYDAYTDDTTLPRPVILTIYQAQNALVKDIQMIQSPEWFNIVYESQNVTYDNLTITGTSANANRARNTDGWNIYRSDTVVIKNSVIVNGDDCVAFKPNATNVLVSNLDCTGSHGISVGSLGQYPGVYDIVENVTAIDIKMADASNGARIKAWAGPNVGSGIVRNITFTNFVVDNVDNPIVIDQCYFSEDVCDEYPSNTYIEDVYFNGISGTASGRTVASLMCSPDGRCSGITVNDLDLKAGTGTATYACQNVELSGNSASLFGNCPSTLKT